MYVVTGALGFIGSALVWEMNQKGIEDIICCDSVNLTSRAEILNKRKYKKFLLKDELIDFLKTSENASQVKAIFHMGACSSTLEMDIEFLKENNTLYTQKLFELCTDHNIPYIYASSGAVYGNGKKGFDDETPAEEFTPLNPYGDSKLNFDIWALKQTKAPSNWHGLRFFNVYGPNEYHKKEMSSVSYKAFLQIKDTSALKLFKSNHPDYKDGEQMRDFVYVKDITRWMLEIYESGQFQSGIYNLGFGKARSWYDLACSAFKNLDKETNVNWVEMPDSLKEQYQYFTEARMEKFHANGGSKPEWPIEKGMQDYYKNYLLKDDPYL